MTIQFLTDATTRLRLDQKYADLEVHCEDQIFRVHRAVVCSASPVMAAQCDGGPKHDGVTTISDHDVDARAMNRMLQYMYTGTYSLDAAATMSTARQSEQSAAQSLATLEKSQPGSLKETLLAHAQMSNIATTYEMPELDTFAQERFGAVTGIWTSLDPEEMIELATEVYSCSWRQTRDMREFVLGMTQENAGEYLNDYGFIESIIKDKRLSEYAMGILASLAVRNEEAPQLKEQHSSEELHTHQQEIAVLKKDLAAALEAKQQHASDELHARQQEIVGLKMELAAALEVQEQHCRVDLQARQQESSHEISELKKDLAAALLTNVTITNEQQTKDKLHHTLVEQLKCNVRRLEKKLGEAIPDTSDARTKTATAMVRQIYEGRMDAFKETTEAQLQKYRVELTGLKNTLNQATSYLAKAHTELKDLKAIRDAPKTPSADLEKQIRLLQSQLKNRDEQLKSALSAPEATFTQLRHQLATAKYDALEERYDVNQLRAEKGFLAQELSHSKHLTTIQEAVVQQLLEINLIATCRHDQCEAHGDVFIYTLERCGPNGYMARCVDCRTRHWGNDHGTI
ncbi:unnamed protein product [Zymoseptoria tritici ST99CH_1A5]|uniref:BTB domain-containing protein n=1 Tax=Zymoseptoria tritici ST99CH_1A5 TaxID=1276529 RepID=A0A1Y6LXT6_ZYMTR|nr:unnamed protein product [Zymoseptoria tritici ST99CH_1A5]